METVEIKVQQMLAASLGVGEPGSADEAEAPEFRELLNGF